MDLRKLFFFVLLIFTQKISAQSKLFYEYRSAFGLVLEKDFVPTGEKLKFELMVADTSRYKTVKIDIYGKKKERFSKIYHNVKEVRDAIDLGFLKKDGTYAISMALSKDNVRFFASKDYLFVKNECGCTSEKLVIYRPETLLPGAAFQFNLGSNFDGSAVLMEDKKAIDTINYKSFYRNLFSYLPKNGSTYSLNSKSEVIKLPSPEKYGYSMQYKIEKDTTYFTIKVNVSLTKSLKLEINDSNWQEVVSNLITKEENIIKIANSDLTIGRLYFNIYNSDRSIYSFSFLHGGGQLEFTQKEKALLFDIGAYRIPRNVTNIYELNKYIFH